MDAVTDFNAGMNLLGYRFLPTGGFDRNGNLVLPGDMRLPDTWLQPIGRVTQQPAWQDLYNILATLTVPDTAWTCWRVGLAFRDGTIQIVLARGISAVGGDETSGLNWANNLWAAVILRLQAYAGRRRVLPQALADAAGDSASMIRGSSYWDREFKDDDPAKARFAQTKWRVITAVDLLATFAKALAQVTTTGRVQATVLWFDTKRPSLTPREFQWRPLHQTYDGWDVRCNHYWWNSGCQVPGTENRFRSYPFIYSSSVPLNQFGLTDVAHLPWELAQAVYPQGSWTAPGLATAAGELEWSVSPDPVLVPTYPILSSDETFGPSEEANAIAVGSQPARIAAHSLPKLGGHLKGIGVLEGDSFALEERFADGDTDDPLLWLPALDLLVARTSTGNYRSAGSLPAVVAARSPMRSEDPQ